MMQPSPEADVDAMVRDMKRANRKPLLIGLGVLASIGLSFGLYVLNGRSAAASELARRGYSQTAIKMRGPFTWAFTGQKGTAQCGGTFERILFSTSISESCFDISPAKVTKPARPEHEILADGLRAQLSSLSVVATHCAAIDPGATKTTCTVEGPGGPAIEVLVAKSGGDWKMDRPARILSRATLAESLSKELQEKAKTPIAVDCGLGLFGYGEGDTLTCTASRKGAKKPGSMTVTFGAEGGYKWKATGF